MTVQTNVPVQPHKLIIHAELSEYDISTYISSTMCQNDSEIHFLYYNQYNSYSFKMHLEKLFCLLEHWCKGWDLNPRTTKD